MDVSDARFEYLRKTFKGKHSYLSIGEAHEFLVGCVERLERIEYQVGGMGRQLTKYEKALLTIQEDSNDAECHSVKEFADSVYKIASEALGHA